jgi:spore maturation protein CgeB
MAGTTQAYFVESLEITDYYEPGKEILLYNSANEFRRLVEVIADDHARCVEIASASQKRTIEDHTYLKRAQFLLETVASVSKRNLSV